MAACAVKRGIITLRDCGEEGINTCSVCNRPVCAEHTRMGAGALLCVECYAKREEEARASEKGATKSTTATGKSPAGRSEETWEDPSWAYGYRHHYYGSYGYQPFYHGSYYDSYYDQYDVRSFDATDSAAAEGDQADAGGFYDS